LSPATSESLSYKWIVLLITSVSTFTTTFDSSVVNIALPSISSSLNMDITTTAWVQTSYLLAISVPLISAGRLGDLKGRKPIFILGIIIFTLGSVLCGLSNHRLQILLFRIIQGLGAALSANAVAILVDAFPEKERGKALGVNTMAVYIGLTAGPLLGGFLIQSLGWQSIFFVNVPIGIVVVLLSIRWLKRGSTSGGQSFDLLGAISFSVCLVPFLLSLTFGGTIGWTSIFVIALMVVSMVSFGLFLLIEARLTQHPMLELSLFTKNRLFAAANFTALAYFVSSFSTSFLISYYLQSVLGFPPSQTGMILLLMPLTMAMISPLTGWLSDKFGSRFMSSLGMTTISVILISFSGLQASSSVQEILIRLLIAGIGTGIFPSPNSSAVMGSVQKEKLGVASGTLGTMRSMGQAISMTVAGTMLGSSTKPVSSFIGAMHNVFILSAVISAIGFFISIAQGTRSTRR